MTTAKFRGNYPFRATVDHIKKEIHNLGFSVELVDEVKRGDENFWVELLVFEKYYMRVESRASLTVLITGDENQSMVDCIASGASQGVFFRFSWGADKNFLNGIRKILIAKGYQEI
ncbi:MAG: DUF6054 family protein [Candidatus Izemoplasmatales bacterium]|jgi:hypothetical protein|nr:DUF6054 family protein [Candidatus Izemoplasmatales bacterium]